MRFEGFRRLALLALVAVVVPACHGGGGKGNPGFKKGGGGAGGGGVALMNNGAFTDYDPLDDGSEASNLEYTLQFLGFDVSLFDDLSDGGIAAALAGKGVLALPELSADINASLTPVSRGLIREFVEDGGILLVMDPSTGAYNLITDAFGITLAGGTGSGPFDLGAGASGTPFAGGPANIPDLSATTQVDDATIPAGAKVIYTDPVSNDAAVVIIPFGGGWIAILGWDWFDAAPFGVEDGGWVDVLDRAMQLGGGSGK